MSSCSKRSVRSVRVTTAFSTRSVRVATAARPTSSFAVCSLRPTISWPKWSIFSLSITCPSPMARTSLRTASITTSKWRMTSSISSCVMRHPPWSTELYRSAGKEGEPPAPAPACRPAPTRTENRPSITQQRKPDPNTAGVRAPGSGHRKGVVGGQWKAVEVVSVDHVNKRGRGTDEMTQQRKPDPDTLRAILRHAGVSVEGFERTSTGEQALEPLDADAGVPKDGPERIGVRLALLRHFIGTTSTLVDMID